MTRTFASPLPTARNHVKYFKHAGEVRLSEAEWDRMQQSCNIHLAVHDAFWRSGFDISPCNFCSLPVVCLPEGLACCEKCAEREGT